MVGGREGGGSEKGGGRAVRSVMSGEVSVVECGEGCYLKCCPRGKELSIEESCVSSGRGWERQGGLVEAVGMPNCREEMYLLEPWSEPVDNFTLTPGGGLLVEGGSRTLQPGSFCLDLLTTAPEHSPVAALCLPPSESHPPLSLIFSVYPIGMIVSLPFLLATLLVYASLPELRNLHGKNLMSQVSALILGYSALTLVQLLPDLPSPLCFSLGEYPFV
jgi:hypothetical protein